MTLSPERINDILKTLPIGYYLGREVKTVLDTTSTSSFYRQNLDTINISYLQLSEAFCNLAEDSSEEEIELVVRTMLYHEISHAIATPKTMVINNVRNIFEDERIETHLKGYYMNTDFGKLVSLITANNDVDNVKSDIGQFFALVRLHKVFKGGEFFNARVNRIIDKYPLAELNRNCEDPYKIHDYCRDIQRLYDSFVDFLHSREENEEGKGEEEPETPEQNNTEETSSESETSSDNMGSMDSDHETEEGNTADNEEPDSKSNTDSDKASSDSKSDTNSDKTEPTDSTDSDEEGKTSVSSEGTFAEKEEESFERAETADVIKKVITNILSAGIDTKMETELARIFNAASKATSMRGSAINSYSGVFDPRSTMRDDYKYFIQKNRCGNTKGFSKTHLNLFLDRSGSFWRNEKAANQIIRALVKIQETNPNFEFTLITIGMDERIEKNYDFHAYGGNKLTENLPVIYNKVQIKGADNYNIVLFDGDAVSDHFGRDKLVASKRFATFNNDKTLIISDPDNREQIETYCKRAKSIITRNYVAELKSELIKNLERLVR